MNGAVNSPFLNYTVLLFSLNVVAHTAGTLYAGKSLLERLMNERGGVYSREDEEGSLYDTNYVTKLLKNFRSHPEILEVPNQRFYKFELQPCADKHAREKFCGWKVIV